MAATSDPPPLDSNPSRPASGKLWLRRSLLGLLWLFLGLATLWAVAAIYFDFRVRWLRMPLAAAYGLAMLAVWWRVRQPWKLMATAASCAVVLAAWLSLRPSNDRDWQAEVAVLPWAEITGHRVALHNIRNFDYRTETDFDPRHYDGIYNLAQLKTVDLFLVYWGSPNIAHTMVSFGFEDGRYVCISIETRKEKGEAYSAVRGFFRQYELTYVIADERDLVRLRTNYRQGEEAYLYRLGVPPESAQALFLEYLRRANSLRDRPEWYNALASNCTTNIRVHTAAASGGGSWDWRFLVNGHADEVLYERGRLPAGIPFAQLKQKCQVNSNARAADQAADFSAQIRRGVPGISGAAMGEKL